MTATVIGGIRAIPWARALNAILWAIAVALAVWNLVMIAETKIDLPQSDEWGDFNPARGLSLDWSWRWIFATTQSAPLTGQRFLSWLFLLADGRNFAVQALVQYCLVALLFFALLAACERRFAVPLGGLAVIFFSAPQAPNFHWPFMVYTYLHVAATSVAVFLISSGRTRTVVTGYLVAAVAFAQAGQGLGSNLAIAAYGTLLAITHADQRRDHAAGVVFILLCEAAWFALVPRDNPLTVLNPPWSTGLWAFLGGLTGRGVGLAHQQGWRLAFPVIALIGLAVWLVAAAATVVLLGEAFRRRLDRFGAFSLGLFAVATASILTMGLARPPMASLALRYPIYGLWMAAAALLVLAAVLRIYAPRSAVAVMTAVNVGFVAVAAPDLDLRAAYAAIEAETQRQLVCARGFFLSMGPAPCHNGPYERASWQFELARDLRVNYCFTALGEDSSRTSVEDCYAKLLSNVTPLAPEAGPDRRTND